MDGQTAVTGIDPGDVVANSSFQKLLNGSTVAKSNFAITPHRAIRGNQLNESITAIYSAAGRYVAADGRNSAGGHCCVHAVAGIGIARSGISDHPGDDVLSRAPART